MMHDHHIELIADAFQHRPYHASHACGVDHARRPARKCVADVAQAAERLAVFGAW